VDKVKREHKTRKNIVNVSAEGDKEESEDESENESVAGENYESEIAGEVGEQTEDSGSDRNDISPTDSEGEGEDDTNSQQEEQESKNGANSSQKGHRILHCNKIQKPSGTNGFVCFFKFLSFPATGFKKESIKLQHASQVKILLYHLDPDGDDVNCLGDEAGDSVRHN